MNVVFLSPAFPPTAPDFCAALAAEGVTVLGVGDEQLSEDHRLTRCLRSYVHEPRMGEYAVLRATVQALAERFGPIDRVESNGEHWLVAEAKLRDDFGIPGLGSQRLHEQRSKLLMARTFASAAIAYPPTISAAEASEVRRFAKEQGYPLVFKPETGSGAENTLSVANDGELEGALDLTQHVVQPFIDAPIITFDGLADRDGQVVFSTSHVYDTGIMQVRRRELDGHYLSLRELPPGLEDVGRRAVAAFEIRERFFHVELFHLPDGSFTALEMNLRPPGGFTTDMMNAALNLDVYALWAAVIAGRSPGPAAFERRYHTAHAGRRAGRHYRYGTSALLTLLEDSLIYERAVPPAFAATMGDVAYLLRSEELGTLRDKIALVQET
jgi:ATP-grasp domain